MVAGLGGDLASQTLADWVATGLTVCVGGVCEGAVLLLAVPMAG